MPTARRTAAADLERLAALIDLLRLKGVVEYRGAEHSLVLGPAPVLPEAARTQRRRDKARAEKLDEAIEFAHVRGIDPDLLEGGDE